MLNTDELAPIIWAKQREIERLRADIERLQEIIRKIGRRLNMGQMTRALEDARISVASFEQKAE